MGRDRSTRYSHVGPSRRQSRKRGHRRLWPAAAALLAVWWAQRQLERVSVQGESMAPLLRQGDRLLVWRRAAVRPGDVVAAPDPREPGRLLLKRVARSANGLVWLEGDNSAHSTDSRHFGPVPLSSVRGKPIYRYAPRDRAGRI